MGNKILDLLTDEDATNGTRALLKEIRKHQKDMPAEVVDDMTFGALVVLYDMGTARGRRLRLLERWSLLYGGLLMLIVLGIVSLHSDVPWLTAFFERIFGV